MNPHINSDMMSIYLTEQLLQVFEKDHAMGRRYIDPVLIQNREHTLSDFEKWFQTNHPEEEKIIQKLALLKQSLPTSRLMVLIIYTRHSIELIENFNNQ